MTRRATHDGRHGRRLGGWAGVRRPRDAADGRPVLLRFGLFLERDYDDDAGRRDELEAATPEWPAADPDQPTLVEPDRWNKTDPT